jgi:hypothetical protein
VPSTKYASAQFGFELIADRIAVIASSGFLEARSTLAWMKSAPGLLGSLARISSMILRPA